MDGLSRTTCLPQSPGGSLQATPRASFQTTPRATFSPTPELATDSYPQTIVEGQAGTGRYPQTTIVEGQTASMPFNTAASPFVANAIAAATQAPPPTLDDIRTQRAPQAEQQAQYHNGVVGGASAVARNPSLVASIVAARQCRGWIGSQVRYTNVSARHAGGAKSTLSSPEVPTQLQLRKVIRSRKTARLLTCDLHVGFRRHSL